MCLNLVSFNPNSAKLTKYKDWVLFFFFFFSALALDLAQNWVHGVDSYNIWWMSEQEWVNK